MHVINCLILYISLQILCDILLYFSTTCFYIRTYIHTYIRTYVRTYIHTYTHTYIHTCVHTYIYIHTYIHTCIHTYVHTYIHAYIHMYIRTYIHTYMHTYIHTYIHKINYMNKNCCIASIVCCVINFCIIFLRIQHNNIQEGQVTHQCSIPEDNACPLVEGTWVAAAISGQGCPTDRLQLHSEAGPVLLPNEKPGHRRWWYIVCY